jgi:hypothetical protein
LPLYDKYFKKYRSVASPENKIIIVEIGVQKGGSLDMWNEYFGKENCEIYGVDIDPECKKLEGGNIKIFIGDQENIEFLRELKTKIPPPDIFIDDGGHLMKQQINTFKEMFPHMKPGGIFLCEDTHSSYWPVCNGVRRDAYTFIEYTKSLIDEMHGYHQSNNNAITNFTLTCSGIYYHDSMVFFEKAENVIPRPSHEVWKAH